MGWLIRSVNSVALISALLVAVPTLAQKKSNQSSKTAISPEEAKARQLFQEGQIAYDLREFDKALKLYSDAYKLKQLPGFLFNVAQCHRQLGNHKDAAFYFSRFIDNSKPDAANIDVARDLYAEEKRLADKEREDLEVTKPLTKTDAPTTPALTPPLSDVPPPPPPVITTSPAATATKKDESSVASKPWFWVVVLTGTAVVAGGIATGVYLGTQNKPRPATLMDINGL